MSDQKTEQKHTPQAFPCLERGGNGLEMTDPGMSLRDYFAAKAMQGLLAQSLGCATGSDPVHGARYAYAMADAMLSARTKEAK